MTTNTKDISKLAKKFKACQDAEDWAVAECEDAADIWKKASDERLLWIAEQFGVLSEAELEEFVAWAEKETPIPAGTREERFRECRSGVDGLTYPDQCPRLLWCLRYLLTYGEAKSKKDTQKLQAAHLRKSCENPFK